MFGGCEMPNFVAAWCETEGSVDDMTLMMFGVDPDRLIYWKQEANAEQALEVLRVLVTKQEVDLVVINSVAGLAPTMEVEKDLKDPNVALTARLMSRLMRVITGPANKNDMTVIFINQLRSTIAKNQYAIQETTSGGRALGYYASQRVGLRRASIDEKTSPISKEEGIKVKCRVAKNRLAKKNPYTTCEYHALYGLGIQSIFELPDMLVEEGVIRRAGSWHYWDDENGEPRTVNETVCKFKSRGAFLEALKTNDVLRETFEEMLDGLIETGNIKVNTVSAEEASELERENEELETSFEDVLKLIGDEDC